MNNKLRPALIGGVTLGLLSAIPFVSAVNMCCCAWILMGGALASYLYIKQSPTPVSSGEGAQLGLLTGVVGAIVLLVVGIPLGLLVGDATSVIVLKFLDSFNPQVAEQVRQQVEAAQHMPLSQRLPQIIGSSVLSAIVTVIFATLGGLLGVALFEKRKAEPGAGGAMGVPPPPPTGFGAPPTTPFAPPVQPPPPPPQSHAGDVDGSTSAEQEER
ncbi:MAG TPA: hypothetical protein VF525_05855 [Pyrinomonadaceae bacterium]|jgi:hypothetical protein